MTTSTKPLVDGADRRVAGLAYAPGVALLSTVAVLLGDRALFGPLPWWAAAGLGLVCGGLLSLIPIDRKAPKAAVVVAAMWSADGGWVGWGWAHEPVWNQGRFWLVGAALLTVICCAAFTFATPTNLGPYPAVAAAGPLAAPLVPGDPWGDLIATASKGAVTGVTTDRIEDWPGGTGYTAYLQCGPDGSTWEDVKKCEPRLGGLLNLPRGGGVTVLADDDRGARAVRIDVLETDAMATPVPYPTGPTSHDDEEW